MEPNGSDPERTCPACGSSRQALLLYGMLELTDELRARLEAGKVALGGCCVSPDHPGWRCLDCRREWGVSEQARYLYELAGSGGSSPLPSLGVRLLIGIFFVPLAILAMVLRLVIFVIIPAIERVKECGRRLLRRGSG
jgi:hypothetical protein